MMIIVNFKFMLRIIFLITLVNIYNTVVAYPITTDSRIRTYIYNENEVFPLILHHGFQSYIEFNKDERIETITLGEPYSWKINNIGNKLFIRPLENNIHTNMIILTDRRSYQFDVISKELEDGYNDDLVYVLKFHYPNR